MDEEARCAVCRIDGRAACVENCQWRPLFPISQVEKVRCIIRNFGKVRLTREYEDSTPADRVFRFETMHRDALVQEAYRYRGGVAAYIRELENLIQQKNQQIAHLQGQHNVPLAPAAPGIPQQQQDIPAQAAPGIPQQQQDIPAQAPPGIPQQQPDIPAQAAPGIPQQQPDNPPPQDPQGHNEPQNPQAQNAAHFSIYLGNRRIFSLY